MNAADLKQSIAPPDFYRHALPGMPTPKREHGFTNAGLCPFHDDKRPNSFFVNLDSGAYRCFSCGPTGGSVIDFTMQREGLSFREAIESICSTWGVCV